MKPLDIGIYADRYRPASAGGVDGWFIDSIWALAHYAPEHRYTLLTQEFNYELLRKSFSRSNIKIVNVAPKLQTNSMLQKAKRLLLRNQQISDEVQRINSLNLDIVSFPRQLVWVEGLTAKVVLTLFDIQHEYFPEYFRPTDLAYRAEQYHKSIRLSDHIVAASQFTSKTLSDKYPEASQKTSSIYPGFADTVLEFPNDLPALSHDVPHEFLLYPANPWIHKNHSRLFAALRRLRDKKNLIIPLVCIGRLNTDIPFAIRNLALAADVTEQVYDLGFVDDAYKIALYKKAKAMVFPSLFEGFGFPILEAMKWGCPVLSSTAASLPEVGGEAVHYFDAYSVERIADAIESIWLNKEIRKELQEKGLRNIQRFSWKDYASQTIALYQQLLM